MDKTNQSPDIESTESAPENEQTLPQFFGTAQDVIQRYSHCVLCGANLRFTHQTDFSRNLTQETAKCLDCGIQVRSVVHRLQ